MPIIKPSFPQLQRGHPLARGLAGAWLFADGSVLSATDSSGLGNHGIGGNSGNQWGAGPAGWVYLPSGSLCFTLGPMPHVALGGPVSASAITRDHAPFPPWGTYIQKGYDGSTEPLVLRTTSGQFTFQTYNPTDNGVAVTDPNVHAYETWYHIVGTYTGQEWVLWVNGVRVATVTTTRGPVDNLQNWGLLASLVGGPPSRIPNSDIDHVMLWQRGFTDAEVAELYRDPYAMFRSKPFFKSPTVPLFIRPDADDSNSGWTDQSSGTTNLYAAIDEPSPASDADYIQSSANPVSDVVRFRISDPTSAVAEPFKVRYRYGISSAGVCTITVRLKQGSTLIKQWVHTDATVAYQTVTQTLSSGEFASITDFTNLFVEFEAGP
jgi:concanavalin A-like lectin/glucanase superfamily protein